MIRDLESGENYVEVSCDILKITEMAVLIDDGAVKVWIPKSQIESANELKEEDEVEIMVAEWIAKEKGLI